MQNPSNLNRDSTSHKRAAVFSEIVDYLNLREFPHFQGTQKTADTVFIEYDRIRANYASFQLDSLFQPVFDYSKRCVVGHEAFLASISGSQHAMLGNVLAPERVFTLASNDDITFLDRLARTLHALNYLAQGASGLLHLNVHPQHLLAVSADHGRVFGGILRQCGLEPQQIVLEICDYAIPDQRALQAAILSWQEKGYRIAIEGIGRQHVQVSRILKLKPEYLKLDRCFLLTALTDSKKRQLFAKVTGAAQDAQIEVIGVGVENNRELDLLRDLGVNLAQGYLFGRPQPYCLQAGHA